MEERKSLKDILIARQKAHSDFISEGKLALERMLKGQQETLKQQKLRNILLRKGRKV